MIRVYSDMVADLFHYGHIEFLKKASALGAYLLVGVCDDATAEHSKWKPILTMEERVALVAGCRYVDEVLPHAPWIIDRTWIAKYHLHLVVHGDDYLQEYLEHIYKIPIEMGILRVVPYTSGISTTDIIRRCKQAKLN